MTPPVERELPLRAHARKQLVVEWDDVPPKQANLGATSSV